MEEEVGNEPAVDIAGSGEVDTLAGAETNGDGGVGAAFDGGPVGFAHDGADFVDAGVEVGEGLHVVFKGLRLGAAQAGYGLLGGLEWRVSIVGTKIAV